MNFRQLFSINNIIALSLSLFATSSSAIYFGSLEKVTPEQLLNNRDAYIVLDVRSVKEFNASHIEGAINIPHTEIAQHLATIQSWQDKEIVVHCKSGYRAGKAERLLLDHKVVNIKHLEGDFNAWQDKGLPTSSTQP
jgi:phage shock protein E